MIRSYEDYIEALQTAGFSMAGTNADGIYAIIDWAWNEPPPYETPIHWYSGNPLTDPIEWLGQIMNKRDDIAYGKLFFKKSGFITKKWFPYFLAVRRGGISFEDAYESGTISHFAKRIYDVVSAHEAIQVEEIKHMGKFSREDKSGFDRALTELQMKMFISPCSRKYKVSQKGEAYGMASTIFCVTEHLFGESVFEQAQSIDKEDAKCKIREQVLKINPSAEDKKVAKFILGN